MSGWLTSGGKNDPLDGDGEEEHDDQRQRHGEQRRHAALMQADQRQRREHDHDSLREVEDARGLEDEHEAERDQRVEDAGNQPLPDDLEEEIGRSHHVREGRHKDRMQAFHSQVLPVAQCGTPR